MVFYVNTMLLAIFRIFTMLFLIPIVSTVNLLMCNYACILKLNIGLLKAWIMVELATQINQNLKFLSKFRQGGNTTQTTVFTSQ